MPIPKAGFMCTDFWHTVQFSRSGVRSVRVPRRAVVLGPAFGLSARGWRAPVRGWPCDHEPPDVDRPLRRAGTVPAASTPVNFPRREIDRFEDLGQLYPSRRRDATTTVGRAAHVLRCQPARRRTAQCRKACAVAQRKSSGAPEFGRDPAHLRRSSRRRGCVH